MNFFFSMGSLENLTWENTSIKIPAWHIRNRMMCIETDVLAGIFFFFYLRHKHPSQTLYSSNFASSCPWPHSKLTIQSFTEKGTPKSDVLPKENDDSTYIRKLQRSEHPRWKLILWQDCIWCTPCIKTLLWDY